MSDDIGTSQVPDPLQGPCADIFERNRVWADQMRRERPDFFTRLLSQQAPKYMWIGCSDSRVPANQVMGLDPGEVFVHRNVANVIAHSDLNALSTLQYAVERLKVEHVTVTGHYGCAGVGAALRGERVGLADNWLRQIQNIRDRYWAGMSQVKEDERADLLCEINSLTQALHVAQSTVVLDAWAAGQQLTVHAWVYGLQDGKLHDLGLSLSAPEGMERKYDLAVERAIARRPKG